VAVLATGRIYTVTSGLVAYTATSATPILSGSTGSAVTADIQAIRVGSYAGSSVSYPTNGTVLVQLARATGTAGGGSSVTPAPHNSTDLAAQSTWLDAHSAAITGLTQGVTLWQQTLPFTAGANWSEWVTPGSEWRLPISANVAVYLTASAAGTATDFEVEIVFAE
jgi:hypothetical protein